MTAAELKTTRESLGLSVSWLAEWAEVTERTVNYWESGRYPIPEKVNIFLGSLEKGFTDQAEQAVNLFLQQAEEQQKNVRDIDVTLCRYRTNADLWRFHADFAALGLPATCHAALLQRTRKALQKAGAQVTIIYMDPDAYSAWLLERSESDNSAMRAAWAASR